MNAKASKKMLVAKVQPRDRLHLSNVSRASRVRDIGVECYKVIEMREIGGTHSALARYYGPSAQ